MGGLGIDWRAAFLPTVSPAEIVLRGTVVYLSLFFCFRFFRREAGGIGIADLLLVVLVADAAQNAMSSEYKSITEGLILVATIVSWNLALDWLGHRYAWAGRLVHPPPLLLIRDGRLQRKNLRSELISEDELMSQLREQGVDDVAKVKSCHLEGDGQFSVVKKEEQGQGGDGPGKSRRIPGA